MEFSEIEHIIFELRNYFGEMEIAIDNLDESIIDFERRMLDMEKRLEFLEGKTPRMEQEDEET